MPLTQNIVIQKYSAFFVVLLIAMSTFSCSSDPDFDESDIIIEYDEYRKYIELIPSVPNNEDIGLMFYPGGLVEPEAYIQLLEPIVLDGYYVVIVKMPSDLAVFAPNRGVNLIEDKLPEFSNWVIAGHSLGGVMATRAYKNNDDVFQGLVLLASYPAESDDISDKDIPVLSIYASDDGLTTISDIDNSKELLPIDTEYFLIEGGNHAQFGSYGEQNDDGEASISREIQQEITSGKIISFLMNIRK